MSKIQKTKPKDLVIGNCVVVDDREWDIMAIEAGPVYTLQLQARDDDSLRVYHLGCRASIGTTTPNPKPKAKATTTEAAPLASGKKPRAGGKRAKKLLRLEMLENEVIPKIIDTKRFQMEECFIGPFSPEVARIRDTKESNVFIFYSFKKDLRMVTVPSNAEDGLVVLMGKRWVADNITDPQTAYRERVAAKQAEAKANAAAKKEAKVKAKKEVSEK